MNAFVDAKPVLKFFARFSDHEIGIYSLPVVRKFLRYRNGIPSRIRGEPVINNEVIHRYAVEQALGFCRIRFVWRHH